MNASSRFYEKNKFFSILFCTIYEKEHIFEYKKKGRQPIVLSFPNNLFVILLRANKIF